MRAVEMVDVVLPPWTAETLLGLAVIEKSLGAAVTVSVTVVLCVALEAVPVTVTEYGPGVVAGATVNVSVELPPAVTAPGLREAVAPAGIGSAACRAGAEVPVGAVAVKEKEALPP